MEMTVERIGEITRVAPKGNIDSSTAAAFGERLKSVIVSGCNRLIVDMKDVAYISSAGFRILLLAAKRADETESRLVLCGVSGRVRHLFDLGGFLDLFPIAGSRDEGISVAG